MKYKESETVELKKSTSELKEAIVSIVAILNKHSKGRLYFGIRNDGIVFGQQVSETTLRCVSKAIANYIEPKIYPEVSAQTIKGKQCVLVEFEGSDAPYFAYGRAYMRVADEDRQLSVKELEQMIIKKKGFLSLWESEVSEVFIKEASVKAVQQFVKRANEAGRITYRYDNLQSVLNKLGLISGRRLLNAAKVLFSNRHMIEVQAAVFAGKDKLTFLDIQSFRGNLFELIQKSEQYIKEHINWRAEIKDFKRKEIPEIPVAAFREAIINSLCHRDFANPKGNEVAIFKDRIEIYNPGNFPEGHTPQEFIRGTERSILRNPLIANSFFLTSDIERWGSGLRRIYSACKDTRVKVEFKNIKTGFLVIFYRSAIRIQGAGIHEGVSEGVSEGVNLVLEYIKNNPGKRSPYIAQALNIPQKTLERWLKKLKKEGEIKYKGSAKTGGYWQIKRKTRS